MLSGTIMDGKSNKYVSEDVMDIFVDSLNSCMMKKVGSKYPVVYVMTSVDTNQLCKLVQIYTQMEKKLRGRNTFEDNWKEDIVCGVLGTGCSLIKKLQEKWKGIELVDWCN